jgi:microsomal dipeptidase-like Zn-dependent dipeptidase
MNGRVRCPLPYALTLAAAFATAGSATVTVTSPAQAAACGAEGQRACTILERTPSCNKNLVESAGKCVHPPCGREGQNACTVVQRIPSCDDNLIELLGKCWKRGVCGAEGQRPCAAVERVPSCNTNLVEKNKSCIHPDCGRMGERACTVVERIPSCDTGLKEIPGCNGDCRGSSGVCADLSRPISEPSPGWTAVTPAADPMRGWADVHVHMFSNLAFGGGVVAGAAYDKVNGIRGALAPDYATNQDFVALTGAELPNVICPALIPNCGRKLLHGDHTFFDQVVGEGSGDHSKSNFGAPVFNGWPTWHSTIHQQVYWKWLERAWRGGLRLMTMLAVTNEFACSAAPRLRGTNCKDSMPAIDKQLDAAVDFQKWLDSQSGGTGKGWFRIVDSPDDAEKVIREGKLAVVIGIESDTLFGCKQKNTCTPEFVASRVAHYYGKGVRHIYPIHDFDGGFGGAALFNDFLGVANVAIEGTHFVSKPCPGISDSPTLNCNVKGLTPLGVALIDTLMDKGMLIDIDHMSAKAIEETIALAKQHNNYPLMVGHGLFGDVHASGKTRHERMRTAAQLEQLRQLGSSVSVMTQDEIKDDPRCLHSSVTFKRSYEYVVSKMGGNATAAIPFGSDFNGVAPHVGPRFGDDACGWNAAQRAAEASRPRLQYPFTIPGFGRFERQVTGQRTFDFNFDGLAHIGLMPDLLADLALLNTNLEPLMRSAAGYIATWRKALAASAKPKKKKEELTSTTALPKDKTLKVPSTVTNNLKKP